MTTETETSHTNTDEVEEESGNLLDTDVEDVEVVDEAPLEVAEETAEDTPEEVPFELPEEYRDNPRFKGIDSEAALFSAIANGGAPELYEFAEGFDEGLAAVITEQAKEADMSQPQVEAMLALQSKVEKSEAEKLWADVNAKVDRLKEEWGEEFKTNVADANKAIRAFDGDGEIRKMMKANPTVANDPVVVKMFKRIHEAIDVDKFLDSDGQPKHIPVDEHGQQYFSSYDKTME